MGDTEDMNDVTVRRMEEGLIDDFFALHSEANGCEWCSCIAWWVPTWENWGDRTAEQNRRLRDELFSRGEFDGYLGYDTGRPVAWCQVGPRDRLAKLTAQFALSPDPDTWAITCFLIAPSHRRKGIARQILKGVIADLKATGVSTLQAYPIRTDSADSSELWCGPEELYAENGFSQISSDGAPLIMELVLNRK